MPGVRISGRTAGVADISFTSQSGSEKPPRGIPGTGLHRWYFPAHFSWLHQPRCVMQQAGMAAESWSWGQPSEAVLHCVQNRLCKTVKIHFIYLYGVVREGDELRQSS